jgi:NitT/TauT family transport system permease protein
MTRILQPAHYSLGDRLSIPGLGFGAGFLFVGTALLVSEPRFIFFALLNSPYVDQVLPSLVSSLGRVICSLLIAFFLSLVFATVLAIYLPRRFINIAVIVLLVAAITPPTIWITTGVMIFGVTNLMIIYSIGASLIFIMSSILLNAFDNIEPNLQDLSVGLELSPLVRSLYVLWPESTRTILFTLRIGSLYAWVSLLGAETSGAREGIGALLLVARQIHSWAGVFGSWFLLLGLALIVDVIATVSFRVAWRKWVTKYE